ncbi:MAG: hypothetical protein KGJ86_06395 [Chloroflexota bacterium]|nr:hypothetical protein [Chloroflexota bacterium]
MNDTGIVIDKDKVDAWTGSMRGIFSDQTPPQVVFWILLVLAVVLVVAAVWFASSRMRRESRVKS